MGTLTVTVGGLESSLTFNNTKGKAIIEGFIAAHSGPTSGTDQEKLDWFIKRLGENIHDLYRKNKIAEALEAARTTTIINEWS